jgi:nucleoside-diphosphate-sugar epimerase
LKILVTGGAGYVGSTLVSLLLNQGHQVRVLDCLMHGGDGLIPVWAHPAFEFQKGDVRDGSAVCAALQDVDAVVHLAAIVGDPACALDPELTTSINLEASLSLLEAAQESGVSRFVFASTCSNYGKMADAGQYVDETSELRPVSLYAETKVAVEKAILSVPSAPDFCATCLRFATVFGVSPRMRFDLTLNEFTMEMITKKHLVIFGEQFWRPYIHVRDMGRAVAAVLAAPTELVAHEFFNVGATDQNLQKQTLVEMIHEVVPEAAIEYVKKDEDPRDYRVTFAKIRQILGYETSRTVRQGIEEVAALVRNGIVQDFDNPKYRN